MDISTKSVGDAGEELAVAYLQENGFVIYERKFRYGYKEIDIIAEKNNVLHIIEVKLRSYISIQEPALAVTKIKQRHLIDAANGYMTRKKLDMEVSFDIVAISKQGEKHKIDFIENAFYPI